MLASERNRLTAKSKFRAIRFYTVDYLVARWEDHTVTRLGEWWYNYRVHCYNEWCCDQAGYYPVDYFRLRDEGIRKVRLNEATALTEIVRGVQRGAIVHFIPDGNRLEKNSGFLRRFCTPMGNTASADAELGDLRIDVDWREPAGVDPGMLVVDTAVEAYQAGRFYIDYDGSI